MPHSSPGIAILLSPQGCHRLLRPHPWRRIILCFLCSVPRTLKPPSNVPRRRLSHSATRCTQPASQTGPPDASPHPQLTPEGRPHHTQPGRPPLRPLSTCREPRGGGEAKPPTHPPPGGGGGGGISHVIAVPAHDGSHMTGRWAGCDHMTRCWRPALLDVPGQPLRPGSARAFAMARAAAAFAPLLLILLCLPLGDGAAAPATLDEPFFQDLCRWASGARVGRGSNPPCRAFVRGRSAAFGGVPGWVAL